MNSSKLKSIYNNIKLYICVDKNILDLFSKYLNLGTIKKVISCDEKSYDVCFENSPVEYCSKENLVKEVKVITNDGEYYLIKEEFIGLNFEEESDDYNLIIYDSGYNVVGDINDLNNYLELKKVMRHKKRIYKNTGI